MISSNIIFLSSTLDTGRKARFTIDIMAATLLFTACWSFWNNTDDYKRPRYGRGIHTYTRVHHLTSQLSSGALSHQFSLPPCLWAAGQFSFSCIYLVYWIYVLLPLRCYTVFVKSSYHLLVLLGTREELLRCLWGCRLVVFFLGHASACAASRPHC